MIPSQFFRRQDNRPARRRQANRRRFLLESLEGRQLLSTFTVTNVNDSGSGSLRQAILSSNASTGSTVNTISFDIGTGGSETITLKSALPAIRHAVVIDGTTQPGTGTTPGIVLSGSSAGTSAVGLSLKASNSTIKGLVVDSFGGAGVLVAGGSNDTITDDYIGVTAAGNAAAGNGGDGIHFTSGAQNNVVSDDVISANQARGVDIDGGSHGNTVEGSMIGTDVTGTHALGNGDSGVIIQNKSNNNTIGGTTSGAGNVLSGNQLRGVRIDSGSKHNAIEGNMIGTDVTGTLPLGNGESGVLINNGSNDNVVGGTTASARNIISANQDYGVHIESASLDNVVEGNYIGTDVSGAKPLGNADSGVYVSAGSNDNTIGGTAAGAGNTISANGKRGVFLDTSSEGNVVQGNMIGTDFSGTLALGNGLSGVRIADGANDNVVGGTTAAARNVISANTDYGIDIDNSTSSNLVEGNYIGTDVSGAKALGNGDSGVMIENGSDSNVIGGTASGAGNTISGNTLRGVRIDTGSEKNVVEGNMIGTDFSGTKPLGNGDSGVLITGGSDNNVVGGTTAAALNVISANHNYGVHIDSGSSGNVLEGNDIGTDVTGTIALGNADSGVMVTNGSDHNVIGGTIPGAGNTISGNTVNGVRIDSGSAGNLIEGNDIGTTAGGSSALGNGQNGVLITGSSTNNVIGGASPSDANVISYNKSNGVKLNGAGKGNLVEGDTIENNTTNGVYIDNSSYTTVSGSTSEYNLGWGILVTSSSHVTLTNNKTAHNGLGGVKG
jgi:titin